MFFALLVFLAVGALVAGGCSPAPEIREYSVSKQVPEALRSSDASTSDTGLLGAMIPVGDQSWFFKVTGPAEAVAGAGEAFREWVQSVRFEGGEPVWELPEQWSEQPGTGMRVATVTIPTGEGDPLEGSVIPLPLSGPLEEAVVANVNRWRGQVGLEPSDEPLAGAERVALREENREAFLVELTGGGGARGGGVAGAMAPMAPPGVGGAERPVAPPVAQTEAGELTYNVPEGWRPGRAGAMRLAAFEAGGAESPVEITVIRAGGDAADNVRRWLGQIRSEVTDEDVQEALREADAIQSLGVEGRLYRLGGDEGQATYAAILPQEGGMSMFVKMSGDASTAEAEAESFESFVRSLEFAS